MKAVLLAVHVLAAVVCLGPIAVAASTFPRYLRSAATASPAAAPALASAAAMHRIARVYGVFAVVVPVFGLATAVALQALTQFWVLLSIGLTIAAGIILATAVVPGQRRALSLVTQSAPADVVRAALVRLATLTGVFNLIWATVVVIMILRPGSTTGV